MTPGTGKLVITAAGVSGDPSTNDFTNTTIYATVPDFTAAGAGTSDFGNVDATNGGACIVQGKIDKDGTGGTGDATTTEDSIVTGSAGFVYLPF